VLARFPIFDFPAASGIEDAMSKTNDEKAFECVEAFKLLADAAKRFAPTNEQLLAERTQLRILLSLICVEFEDRYDGAPDSTTLWMGDWIRLINEKMGTHPVA
jgi:hypothetical protein